MQSKGKAVLGDVTVDFDRMEILCRSQSIPATSLEFRLLKFFIDNPNRIFSREELISAVWKRPPRAHSRAVDTCIWNLRRKVEKDPATPIFFQTVHGEGYKFVSTKLPQGLSGTQSMRGSCSR
jgi:DNA-binding response OmpR family regulator